MRENRLDSSPGKADVYDVSICICTFKRPEGLRQLLQSLTLQTLPQSRFELIIVDNDRNETGLEVVRKFREEHPDTRIAYDVEPNRNIAMARNRCVQLASGKLAVFIDDDEFADPNWLRRLVDQLSSDDVAATFGPVVPILLPEAPDWIRRGRFFERPRFRTGCVVPGANPRTGNAAVKRNWLEIRPGPFDPAFGARGGEDLELFEYLRQMGADFRWADDAVVFEAVPLERCTTTWLLLRSFRNGLAFNRVVKKHKGKALCMYHAARGLASAAVALPAGIFFLPFGYHRSVAWFRRAMGSLGKIRALVSEGPEMSPVSTTVASNIRPH